MGENTTQVEGLKFVVKDEASPAAERLAKAFDGVQHASERAGSRLKDFGKSAAIGALGAVGLGLGLREVVSKAKEANLELENSAKKIAGVHFALGGWKSSVGAQDKWNYSLAEGTEIVAKLEASESKLKLTRGELSDIYASAYGIGSRHNLNQQQMLDLTVKLAASQKILGTNADATAMQITRMALTGNMRGMDKFAVQMRSSITNLKEFHKLSEGQRFAKIQTAMGDLVPAAVAMGKGMSGAMFDIRKGLTDMTRDVSGPLFQEISGKLATWATHLHQVQASGKTLMAEYGEKLVGAFHALESATEFIHKHWMAIAVLWGSAKFAGMAGGIASGQGPLGSIAKFLVPAAMESATGLGKVGTEATSMAKGLSLTTAGLGGLVLKASLLAGGLELLYLGATKIAEWVDENHSKNITAEAQFGKGSILAGAGGEAAGKAYAKFQDMQEADLAAGRESESTAKAAKAALVAFRGAFGDQVIGAKGAVDVKAATAAWAAMDTATRGKVRGQLGIHTEYNSAEYLNKRFLDEFVNALVGVGGQLAGRLPGDLAKSKSEDPHKTNNLANTPINIGKIEITQDFKDANPDRVFHRVLGEIAELGSNLRSSVSAPIMPGGI